MRAGTRGPAVGAVASGHRDAGRGREVGSVGEGARGGGRRRTLTQQQLLSVRRSGRTVA